MTDDERELFLRCARQLVGTRYDIVRYVLAAVFVDTFASNGCILLDCQGVSIGAAVGLEAHNRLKSASQVAHQREPGLVDLQRRHHVCIHTGYSKALMHCGSLSNPGLRGVNRVLLAGCSEKFREVLAKARKETELGTFLPRDATCLTDFLPTCTYDWQTFSRSGVPRCQTSHVFVRPSRTRCAESRFRLWTTP